MTMIWLMASEPRAPTKKDNGWCINCFRPFSDNDVRHWFGAGPQEVGPFCATCDRTIKLHTRGLKDTG